MNNDCGHRAEVKLSWIGYQEQRRVLMACEVCAALVWNNMAQPLRETFTCEDIETAA